MVFQVFNEMGVGVMKCTDVQCIPDVDILKDMYTAGYRFKLNGKAISVKAIKEIKHGG